LVRDSIVGKVPDGIPFKILVLDEADNMTGAAQQALRRTMENYTQTCRMILICNFSNKIILPIQSRCVVFRYALLSEEEIKKRVQDIAKKEDVNLGTEGLNALIYVSNGDLRRAVNYLQACSTISGEITQNSVYKITGKINPNEIRKLIMESTNGNFMRAKELLESFIFDFGLSARNLVSQIHSEIYLMDEIDEFTKIKIIRILSLIDYRLSQGSSEKIQLNSLIARFSLINIE